MHNDKKQQLKEKAKEELRLMLLITAYLTAFFVAFLTYRRLISREFGVTSFHYGFAVIEALIIAKVILIGKAIGLGKAPTKGALAFGVLRRSVVYAGLVAVFSVLEHVVEGLIHGKSLAVSVDDMFKQGIYEILGKTLVIFVAFIPFFGIWEVDRVIGDRKLFDLFFKKAPPAAA
ncbi:MAG TPA: hypothetical protein VGR00_00970 [Thermoanaerobaculia bacterium]|nr:hypothetical protein [Thermoanaerobaculia bacterium]